jgi:hypothetical protein
MKKYFVVCLLSIFSVVSYAQKKVTLKTGTIIPLQSVRQVKAADVNEGEYVDFRVVNDIMVDNHVVIEKGSIVKGVVNEACKSTIAGTKGRLVININHITLAAGEHVYCSNSAARIYGKNRTPLAVITGLFVRPCIFIPGTKAVMPEGYEVHAYVAANTEISVK